jgi:hypothetical protein
MTKLGLLDTLTSRANAIRLRLIRLSCIWREIYRRAESLSERGARSWGVPTTICTRAGTA